MFHRLVNLPKSHSFFLFGARGTGKSKLLEKRFPSTDTIFIDLLEPAVFDELSIYPERLRSKLAPHIGKKTWVVIDEVQKAPKILDVVHKEIFEENFNFALTGSSARKLKRGCANLLAGRAFLCNLFPLTFVELADHFSLEPILNYGSLPGVVNLPDAADRRRFLKAYAQTYIKEEIIAEQIVRNLPPFRKFMEIAAQQNSEIINYSNIAKDVLSDPKSISNYYDILEDTLLGFRLQSYHASIRKKQKLASKFYFLDCGVVRTLAGMIDQELVAKSYEYGQVFETFIINEIYRLLTYAERQFQLSYIRVNDDLEIDLIVERHGLPTFLIEIKSTDRVDERHARGLELLGKDFKNSIRLILSRDNEEKKLGETTAIHWRQGIELILRAK